MLKLESPRRNKYQFDNLQEVADYCRAVPAKWQQRASRQASAGKSWDLGVSYDEAVLLAKVGWPEGIRTLFTLATAVPNNIVRTRELSVAGEMPDIPRYLAGDPFNMIHRGKKRVPKPAMTIVASIGANCMVSANEIMNHGAAMVALIDRLESKGVRVELIGCWRSTELRDRSSFCFSWTIKRAEDALDLGAVAFGLGHPAMLRRLAFGVMERSPQHTEIHHYGVSSDVIGPVDLVEEAGHALFIGGVGSNGHQCRTMAGALDYTKAKINTAYRALGYEADIAELEELD